MTRPEPWVLVVDDEPAHRLATVHALRRVGVRARVREADDGRAALDVLHPRRAVPGSDVGAGPEIVLLDLDMRRVDGYDVLLALSCLPSGDRPPVVVVTASCVGWGEVRERCRRLGASGVLAKPIDEEELRAALERTTPHLVPTTGRGARTEQE